MNTFSIIPLTASQVFLLLVPNSSESGNTCPEEPRLPTSRYGADAKLQVCAVPVHLQPPTAERWGQNLLCSPSLEFCQPQYIAATPLNTHTHTHTHTRSATAFVHCSSKAVHLHTKLCTSLDLRFFFSFCLYLFIYLAEAHGIFNLHCGPRNL